MNLIDLATLFRTLNLYAHHAHNMASGLSFIPDHGLFGELYSAADGFYDDLIERHIGTVDDKIDLCKIVSDANSILELLDDNYFENILKLLKEAVVGIDELSKDKLLTNGTLNLIQGQSDQVEVFIYKIKRRLK